MIDYQISKESSPVADITYLIFNCTDFVARSKYFHDWINYYHSELEKCLIQYGLKIDTYPRDQLEMDLRRHAKFALGQSIMLASFLIQESKDAANFKQAINDNKPMGDVFKTYKLTLWNATTLKKFKNRVIGLIDTFCKLGYIKE